MNRIVTLPQTLVNKIAAGEVVDRPASIIKELIENSIDANATQIRINIQKGGIETIEINDNGDGMSPEDAKVCFLQHTTSKIKTLEDLNKIFTFGFRGEAISSICAVSQTIIHTQALNQNPIRLIIENGKIIDEETISRTQGTTIKTSEIFRYLPARKKFLKSPTTEARHIHDTVNDFAYIYPDIKFELIHNSKQIYKLDSTKSLKQRFLDLNPNFQTNEILDIVYQNPKFKIDGLIIKPSKIDTTRRIQNIYLNKRPIIERSLNKAITLAYQNLIPSNYFPCYIINITIDPSYTDVNIHPRKLEVKIEDISSIFSALKNTIRNVLDFDAQTTLKQKFENFHEVSNSSKTYSPQNLLNSSSGFRDLNSGYHNSKIPVRASKPQIDQSIAFTEMLLRPSHESSTYNSFQVFDTYIIIQKEDRLEIIDQHAADERINFEKIWNRFKKQMRPEMQDLLVPIEVTIQQSDIELIKEYITQINKLGIDIDIFGNSKIKINAMPIFARQLDHIQLIQEILDTIKTFEQTNIDKILHKFAESIACHTSIRAGQRLSQQEINKLIQDLENTNSPYSCPHGRPIIWTLTKTEIEKKFKRRL